MLLLRFLSCALALAAVSARKAPVRSRKGNSLQQVFDTITIDLEGFSEVCANDFLLQSAPAFQNEYLALVNDFAEQCVVRNPVDFQTAEIVLNTDPCEQIVDRAQMFGDMSCTAVNSQLCSLVIDETIDLLAISGFFLRSVYTYYICVPTACPSADVANALDQALVDLQNSLQAGTFFEDEQIDVLSNTFYEAVLFCDADGVPARFGQGFNLTLEITGESDVVDPQGAFITIESTSFSVDTTVSPAGLDFTAEIYGTNAAAELNADMGFQRAGCIAYWRTESTVMDSRLELFCPTDAPINALERNSNGVPLTDPVPIQQFSGHGFTFGGAAQMDEFDEPEPPTPPLVLTTPGGLPGITAPIPTLGLGNGASTMGPTTLVAAASFVAAALAL